MRRRLDRDDSGFTLVELGVCVVLIGVLNGIALPVFVAQKRRAQDADASSLARNAGTAQEAHLTDRGHYTRDMSELPGITLGADDAVSVVLYRDGDRTESTAADESDAVGGFCVEVQSRSGRTVVFDSLAGGLQPRSVRACPRPAP